MTFKQRVEAFWAEVHALEEKYHLDLSHEDGHGAFLAECNNPPPGLQSLTAYREGGDWFHWRDAAGAFRSGSYSELLKALGGVEP